jgi:hypothetical protein
VLLFFYLPSLVTSTVKGKIFQNPPIKTEKYAFNYYKVLQISVAEFWCGSGSDLSLEQAQKNLTIKSFNIQVFKTECTVLYSSTVPVLWLKKWIVHSSDWLFLIKANLYFFLRHCVTGMEPEAGRSRSRYAMRVRLPLLLPHLIDLIHLYTGRKVFHTYSKVHMWGL